jgi:hypothetical protein
MLLIRPDAAHRVTVFGSTRKSAATSPGVSRRSLLPSTFHPSYLRFGACHQCGENIRLLPCFPQNGPLVLVVSFALGRRGIPAVRYGRLPGRSRRAHGGEAPECGGTGATVSRGTLDSITDGEALLTTRCDYLVSHRRHGYHSSGFADNPGMRGIRLMRGRQGAQESAHGTGKSGAATPRRSAPEPSGLPVPLGPVRPGLRSRIRVSQAGALG